MKMNRASAKRVANLQAGSLAALCGLFICGATRATDYSAPAILQDFENSYKTIQNRAADIFVAGYDSVYTPPPGRADSGNFSVGYDQYDRFDLGKPGNPTLYGTETGLKSLVNNIHRIGASSYVDLVWNHSGFTANGQSDGNGKTFYNAGGYPGLNITLPGNVDGDYHSSFDNSTTGMRLSGLIDIAQESNFQMIRSPVNANDLRNIRPGTIAAFGRIANVPDANNARFYPDLSLQPIVVFDPATGEQNIAIHPFNNTRPLNGTAVPENALGYLMRNAQWLVQSVGVDGFRVDAAKSMPTFVQNYLDRAVYRSSFRTLLNGQQQNIFSFSEVYDGDQALLQQFVRKDINPATPGVIGGNRDALDFPLFFAMQSNLSGNGLQNDWRNVAHASFDRHDDGAMNGSQAVHFVSSHDNGPPILDSVAYAYTLMLPGNSIVYANGKEFGNNRGFPVSGRGDALGGTYGKSITTLVDLRNRYGTGNYIERDLEKESFAFERQGSSIVMLSNRTDAGYDSRTLPTSFAPGTPLIELTGNAGDATADTHNDIPKLLVVNNDGTVNARFLRNSSFDPNTTVSSHFTGRGYLIYGLASPQGALAVSNVSSLIPGKTPNPATSTNIAFDNGTTRVTDASVVKANSFQITLTTNQVNLLGTFRDKPADGDNALIKLDGGVDLNGNGVVDNTTPNTPQYGFESFTGTHSPGWFNANGNGTYAQTLDATQLADGYHYVTVRAFRHREDGGPGIFTDFKQVIYLDRNKPISMISSFNPIVAGTNQNQRLTVDSVDQLADNVHVFFDKPASLTDAQMLALVGSGSQTNQLDTYTWTKDTTGLTSGNHVATVVTYKPDGNSNVQRFPGLLTATIFGAGLGDINHDGTYTVADVEAFKTLYNSLNTRFDAAADFTADGLIDRQDVSLFGLKLQQVGADTATINDFNAFAATVPEPCGLLMVVGGMTIILRRKRNRSVSSK